MKLIKNIVKQIVGRFGYEIRFKLQDKRIDLPYIDLHQFLSVYFIHKNLDDFFFVQVGANDGKTGDPVFPFVQQYSVSGLLLEPQPLVFEALKENYEGQEQLIFENVALGKTEGEMMLYQVSDDIKSVYDAAVPGNTTGIASFDKTHIERQLKKNIPTYLDKPIDHYIKSEAVPTRPFNTLFDTHGITRVDLLQIDTEGYDYVILQQFFENCDFLPDIINYESFNMSFEEQEACAEMLRSKGYALFNHAKNDTCAYRIKL